MMKRRKRGPVGKDKGLLADGVDVLSREVVLTPATTTIIIMQILTVIDTISSKTNITIFSNINMTIMITFSFSLPSLFASLVFPLDPSFDPLDSFVGLVLDPP